MDKKLYRLLLLLSFTEGGAVMCTELLGARMVAPYFGNSLQVWASVLGITLFALTAGYYVGGLQSSRSSSNNTFSVIYLLGGFMLLLMPLSSRVVMALSMNMPLTAGLIVSLLIFLVPPLLCMGMVSPFIIFMLTQSRQESGSNAGLVYAVSTLGGIVSTFILAFVVVPQFGVRLPCMLFGAIMMLAGAAYLITQRGNKRVLLILLPACLFMLNQLAVKNKTAYGDYKIRYNSEGLLGQIKVVDKSEQRETGLLNWRFLLVNNTWQTTVINEPPYFSLFDYVYFFKPVINSYPPGSKALVFGLGGGSLVRMFTDQGYDLKVIDIERRLKPLAVKYFSLDPNTQVIIDDARHYLNRETAKYDVIVFDCFLGETPPVHLLTTEAFQKAKSLLTSGGSIMVQFYGSTGADDARASWALYKTITSANLHCDIIQTNSQNNERNNIIFVAGNQPFNFSKLPPVTFSYNQKSIPWSQIIYDKKNLDVSNEILLTDDNPILENLLAPQIFKWRTMLNKEFAQEILENDVPLFY